MALIPPGEPETPPTAPPAGETPPAGAPPAGETPPSGDDRPEWVPEELWKDGKFDTETFDAFKSRPAPAADKPETADAYALPAIDGFDHEAAGQSALFSTLRAAAFESGLGQEQFNKVITDYVGAETAKAEAFEAAQTAALGPQAGDRLKALGSWLDRTFTPQRAAALRAAATTADGVEALEEMMNGGKSVKPRDDPPPANTGKTEVEILALMKTPAYAGKESERDPKVIAEVEAWFAANAKPKQRK